MHRSGTSLVAEALSKAGVDLGTNLYPEERNHDLTFFEHQDILKINEEILRTLHSSYDDIHALPPKWNTSMYVAPFKEKIKEILWRDFPSTPIFAIKDPRISILLPLYLEVIRSLPLNAKFIVCERSDMEIAFSLYKNGGLPFSQSLELTKKYKLTINQWLFNQPHIRIQMDSFIADPIKELQKIEKEFNISLDLQKEKQKEIRQFVQPELKDSTLTSEEGVLALAKLFDAQERECKELKEKVDVSYTNYNETYHQALKEKGELENEINFFKDQVVQLTHALTAQKNNDDANYTALQAEYEHIKKELTTRDEKIAELHKKISQVAEEKDKEIIKLSAVVEERNKTIARVESQLQEELSKKAKKIDIVALEKERHDLVGQVESLSKDIVGLNHTLAHRDHYLASLEKEIRDVENIKARLYEAEDALGAIHRSVTWKILFRLQHSLDSLFPQYTKRRAFYESIIRTLQRWANKGHTAAIKDKEKLKPFPQFSEKVDVLFINHEESRTGAPRILFSIAKEAMTTHSIAVVSKWKGGMSDEFQNTFKDKLVYPHEVLDEPDRYVMARMILEKIKPKIVFVSSIVSYEYAYEAKKMGIPTIFHVHEIGSAYDVAILPEHHEDFAQSADLFIAVSEATKHDLIHKMKVQEQSIVLLHEFIDSEMVRSKADEISQTEIEEIMGVRSQDIVVVACGWFEKRKGADIFAKLAFKMRVQAPHIKFVWIGRGPLAREAISHTYDKYRDAFIHIHEQKNPFPYMKRADIFFLSSREDPFPLVVLEAMALAKPIVAFAKSGGASEAAGDGAVLIKGFEVEKAAKAITKLVQDPLRRQQLGQTVKERQQEYDRSSLLPQFLEIIDQFLRKENNRT